MSENTDHMEIPSTRGADAIAHPAWLTSDVAAMIGDAMAKGWSLWHWPAGEGIVGETLLIAPGYSSRDVFSRWKDIKEGFGGEAEPFLGLDRLLEISTEAAPGING